MYQQVQQGGIPFPQQSQFHAYNDLSPLNITDMGMDPNGYPADNPIGMSTYLPPDVILAGRPPPILPATISSLPDLADVSSVSHSHFD